MKIPVLYSSIKWSLLNPLVGTNFLAQFYHNYFIVHFNCFLKFCFRNLHTKNIIIAIVFLRRVALTANGLGYQVIMCMAVDGLTPLF